MIYTSEDIPKNVTDWITAIGTLGAVIVALFFYFWDRIRDWWNKPKLRISLRFSPPDCHQMMIVTNRDDGRRTNLIAYWFRLAVTNTGRKAAQDLEAIISNMRRKQNDAWHVYSPFLPANLQWTHILKQYLPFLLPNTEKHFDLGHIIEPNFRLGFAAERNPALNIVNQTTFHFELCAQPTNGYNNIPPGEYMFDITVGASNCSPVTMTVALSFTGLWSMNEQRMLGTEVVLKSVE